MRLPLIPTSIFFDHVQVKVGSNTSTVDKGLETFEITGLNASTRHTVKVTAADISDRSSKPHVLTLTTTAEFETSPSSETVRIVWGCSDML